MEKVLFVDDEPNILNAFKRHVQGKFELVTAQSATEGFELLQKAGPFSVVISDMHMPGIPGSQFLRDVAQKSPDSIRVMLTGLADQRTAIKAINEGQVYRFLTKPCSVGDFESTLEECILKRRLVKEERDILQNTLGGVIKLITDLLSAIDPEGAVRSLRLRKVVKEIAKALKISPIELELAVMLAGVGKFTLPLELLQKATLGQSLTETERTAVNQSVLTSSRLLRSIPRLERVAQILQFSTGKDYPKDAPLRSEAMVFRIASLLDLTRDDLSLEENLTNVSAQLSSEESQLISQLLSTESQIVATQSNRFEINLSDLCPGQILLEDVTESSGKLLLKKGFAISEGVIEKLKTYHTIKGLKLPLVVNERIPTRG